jgi:hypothetical protein
MFERSIDTDRRFDATNLGAILEGMTVIVDHAGMSCPDQGWVVYKVRNVDAAVRDASVETSFAYGLVVATIGRTCRNPVDNQQLVGVCATYGNRLATVVMIVLVTQTKWSPGAYQV